MTILFILDHGSSIRKKNERFLINFGMSGKPSTYVPANRVDGIVIDAKTSFSSGALDLIMDYGIPVSWSNYTNGMMLIPFNSHGTVSVRRAQYAALNNNKGVHLAGQFVNASCRNRLTVLRRITRKYPNFKGHLNDWIDIISENLKEFTGTENETMTAKARQNYLNQEAKVAKNYYAAIREILSEIGVSFEKRSRRPAGDLFNAMLNYGNAILKTQISQRITITGLDIFGGYLHVDRSGRESLILDLMEEFRQVVVDEIVLELFLTNEELHIDFEGEEIILSKDTKKMLINAIFEKLYKKFGELKIIDWVLFQARQLCQYLQDTIECYAPFTLKVNDPW